MLSKSLFVTGLIFAVLAGYYAATFLLDNHYYAEVAAKAINSKSRGEQEVLGILNYVTGEIREFRLRTAEGLLQAPAREGLERGWVECGDYVGASIVLLHFANYKAHRVYLKSGWFSRNVVEVFYYGQWRIVAVALSLAFLTGRCKKALARKGAPADWKLLVQLRELELKMLLDASVRSAFTRVLEIGSGRGAATGGLSRRFPIVVAVDLSEGALREARKAKKGPGKVYFVSADAQGLPFKPGSFDLIHASHILEHIEDRKEALREMDFVLSDDGGVLVALPTRFWKFLHLTLYYGGAVKIYLAAKRNIRAGRKPCEGLIVSERIREMVARRWSVRDLLPLLVPSVHGTYRNHRDEFLAYRKRAWEQLFQETGFDIVKSLPLYFYSPYAFLTGRFLNLRRLAVKMGLVTSWGFVLMKRP